MNKMNPDINYIRKYVQGALSHAEMHALEKAAHADEMLMDIIMGVEFEIHQELPNSFQVLQARIQARIQVKPVKKLFPWSYAAAAAALLLVAGFASYWLYNDKLPNKEIAQAAESPVSSPQAAQADSLPSLQPSSAQVVDSAIAVSKQSRLAHTNKIAPRKEMQMQQLPPLPLPRLNPAQEGIAMQRMDDEQSYAAMSEAPQSKAYSRIAAREKQPIVVHSTSPNKDSMQGSFLTGKIIDSETGAPIANVQVKELQSNNSTYSNEDGKFMLTSLRKKAQLGIDALGYKNQQLVANNSEQTIQLSPDETTLEEVALITKPEPAKAPKSAPSNGWKKYNRYLKSQIDQADAPSGTVTLAFYIAQNGEPKFIRIVQSTLPALNDKAIAILKNGSSWRKGSIEEEIRLTLEF